jgi:hypothetical protein
MMNTSGIVAVALALAIGCAAKGVQAAPTPESQELAVLKAEVTGLEAKVKAERRKAQIAKLLLRKEKAKGKLAITDPEGAK